MEPTKIAKEILTHVGGRQNIESAAHCATRLRLVIKDESKINKARLEELEDVKGCFNNAGLFQIILGPGLVNKVYAEMLNMVGGEQNFNTDIKKATMKKLNPLQRLARILSNIFVPIIPAIVASGLLMGLLGCLRTYQLVQGDSGWFIMLDIFANTAFVFLPVLVAYSAAKEFAANPVLAAALGGIMIHPALQNAWTVGGGIEKSIIVLGIPVGMVGYQGTVLPVLIAVWFMSIIERNLRKIVPNFLDIIVTPFTTLAVAGFFSLVIIGPFGRMLGGGISTALNVLYNQAGSLAGMMFGGVYSAIVITGIHHSFHAIELELIRNVGSNFLLPIWAMANVAQGGAAIAVYFKTQDIKIKAIALPAALSCFLGITETAIFGTNLRYGRPFIAAAIGGAVGGAYVVATKVAMTAVGLTGIPGISIVKPEYMVHYIIGMAVASGVAFAVTYGWGLKEDAELSASQDAFGAGQ